MICWVLSFRLFGAVEEDQYHTKKNTLYIWVWNGYNELILVLDLENFLFSLLLPIAEDFDHLGAHYATKRPNAPSFAENIMCA